MSATRLAAVIAAVVLTLLLAAPAAAQDGGAAPPPEPAPAAPKKADATGAPADPTAAPDEGDEGEGEGADDEGEGEGEGEGEDEGAEAEPESTAIFILKDSARIVGRIETDQFRIDTGYGILTVPVRDIFSIRFGKRADPDLIAKIGGLVKQLGDGDFSVRDKATAELSALGALAESELTAALESDDAEVKARAKKILESIKKEEDEATDVIEDDEIVTKRFTVRGTLAAASFDIETRFGVLTVPKKHVKTIQFREPPTVHKTIKLPATASAQVSYHDTGIEIQKGDEVTIAASGTVTIGGWGMTVTPDGIPNNRFMGNFPLGALLMMIGDGGQPTQVGSTWSEKVDRRGTLKLAMAAPNQQNTGGFKVKITVRRKVR